VSGVGCEWGGCVIDTPLPICDQPPTELALTTQGRLMKDLQSSFKKERASINSLNLFVGLPVYGVWATGWQQMSGGLKHRATHPDTRLTQSPSIQAIPIPIRTLNEGVS